MKWLMTKLVMVKYLQILFCAQQQQQRKLYMRWDGSRGTISCLCQSTWDRRGSHAPLAAATKMKPVTTDLTEQETTKEHSNCHG